MPEHIRPTRNRRELLCDAFCGFGALAFTSMAQAATTATAAARNNPLAAKAPHHAAKAKSVILIGSPALTTRYALALQAFGCEARTLGAQATWRGLWALARTLEHA